MKIKREVRMVETELLKADMEGIERAAKFLRDGGLVGMPTETVYGLAANALDGKAVAKIFAAKGRPMDNPLIVHISDFSQIYNLVAVVPESAKKLAKAFWPGPLTMILPKADCIPDEVSAGLPTVAIRFPSHPTAQQLITTAGLPLAAPSANLSGKPSPTTAEHVMHDLSGKIEAVIDGGPCKVGVESTVITLASNPPRLLRPGGITLEQLRSVLGEVEMDDAVLHPLKEGVRATSPGMKYKHYSPKANVIILDGSDEQYRSYVNSHIEQGVMALCYDEDCAGLKSPYLCYGAETDMSQMAHHLFDALREVDLLGAKTVYARCPAPKGVGLAVYNRLMRAAGFEVLHL
jgi:L-threonylcarbamoyladenylate synthase